MPRRCSEPERYHHRSWPSASSSSGGTSAFTGEVPGPLGPMISTGCGIGTSCDWHAVDRRSTDFLGGSVDGVPTGYNIATGQFISLLIAGNVPHFGTSSAVEATGAGPVWGMDGGDGLGYLCVPGKLCVPANQVMLAEFGVILPSTVTRVACAADHLRRSESDVRVPRVPSSPSSCPTSGVTWAGVPSMSTVTALSNCSDYAIVKVAFGTRSNLPGWDSRADLNMDKVVDIRDLALHPPGSPVRNCVSVKY